MSCWFWFLKSSLCFSLNDFWDVWGNIFAIFLKGYSFPKTSQRIFWFFDNWFCNSKQNYLPKKTVSRTWFKRKYLPISWSGNFGICLSCLYTHILIGSPLGLVDLSFPPGSDYFSGEKVLEKWVKKRYFYLIKSVIVKIFGNGKDIGLPYIKAFHWGKYFSSGIWKVFVFETISVAVLHSYLVRSNLKMVTRLMRNFRIALYISIKFIRWLGS